MRALALCQGHGGSEIFVQAKALGADAVSLAVGTTGAAPQGNRDEPHFLGQVGVEAKLLSRLAREWPKPACRLVSAKCRIPVSLPKQK